jgi:hypothetical protein
MKEGTSLRARLRNCRQDTLGNTTSCTTDGSTPQAWQGLTSRAIREFSQNERKLCSPPPDRVSQLSFSEYSADGNKPGSPPTIEAAPLRMERDRLGFWLVGSCLVLLIFSATRNPKARA